MSKNWNPAENTKERELGSDEFNKLSIESKVISAKAVVKENVGEPLTIPIYHSSVYKNTSIQQYSDIVKNGGYIYQRLGNPTCETAEVMINTMEGGKGSIVLNSGLAAVNALFLTLLKQGDHIVASNPCYSGSQQFIDKILCKFGVEVTWISTNCIQDFADAIKENTKIVYVETPSNPTMGIVDLEKFSKLKRKNVITVVDATFGSPVLVQPIKFGIDVSLHSCSKYLGGHTDLIGGCLTFASVELWKEVKSTLSCTGFSLSPMDASLLIRGMKTLHLRMEKHSSNALSLAKYLESSDKVKKVWYPGLPSHPDHKIAREQMCNFGGMIGFEMESETAAISLVENVKLINLGVSLGGTESLIEHPGTMTHGPLFENKHTTACSPAFLRFSVGLENPDDLIRDLAQAMEKTHTN